MDAVEFPDYGDMIDNMKAVSYSKVKAYFPVH